MRLCRVDQNSVAFHCPGCQEEHRLNIAGDRKVWEWNGSMDAPTFSPSVLIRVGHYIPGQIGKRCWCTWNAEHPDDPAPFKCGACHSFVKDGKIQFLSDSTHELAGTTAELPELL